MNRTLISLSVSMLILAGCCLGQSGSVIPEHGAGHAQQTSCVILKRMGPADQVTSRMYSFGIRGKQFQYIEGKLPDGFPFHGRLTDHDVRNLQSRGTEVIVLESHYGPEDLKQARADCRGETGKAPNLSEAKAAPGTSAAMSDPPANAAAATAPAADPPPAGLSSATSTFTGKLSVVSTPDGADIEVDGTFVGNTPSDLQLGEGNHTVTVKKTGFKDWERKMKVTSGSNVRLSAQLEPVFTQ